MLYIVDVTADNRRMHAYIAENDVHSSFGKLMVLLWGVISSAVECRMRIISCIYIATALSISTT